jgi:hypothetical protein
MWGWIRIIIAQFRKSSYWKEIHCFIQYHHAFSWLFISTYVFYQVLRLLSIGGATLQKGVANTLAKVMSAPCMTMLNMLGGGPKGKKAFATTRLYGVVLGESHQVTVLTGVHLVFRIKICNAHVTIFYVGSGLPWW